MSEFNTSTADQSVAPRAVFASPEQRTASDQVSNNPKRKSGGQSGNQNARKIRVKQQ